MTKEVRPVKPSEITKEKRKTFPDAVLESFNELITKEWNGRSAIIKQDDVVALMVKKGLKKSEIFDGGWLDVEDTYRSAGWQVEYDCPGHNEDYAATFTFKHRRKS